MRSIMLSRKLLTSLLITFLFTSSAYAVTHAKPQTKREQVIEFVNKALAYEHKHGTKKALKIFSKPHGRFVKGSLYIFVINYQGIVLSHGAQPDLIGKNIYDLRDIKGQYIIQSFIKMAKRGGGWVTYYWLDPVTDKVELKHGYIVPVKNKGYFIGSGYYEPDK